MIVCPSSNLLCFFFKKFRSISSKNSNNSVAGDAHLCFISKNNTLPEKKRLLEHFDPPFWTKTLFFYKQHFLKNAIFLRIRLTVPQEIISLHQKALWATRMRSCKVLGSFKTSVTKFFLIFVKICGVFCSVFGPRNCCFSGNICMHTVHWILISSWNDFVF